MNEDIIHINRVNNHDQRKRAYEIRSALGIAIFVLACSWLQITYYGRNSWTFIAIFNINTIIMLLALFLVARNVVKLIIERKHQVFGSRIRSKIVIIFVMLTLIPTAVIFFASSRIVGKSVDYWLTSYTENALQSALDIRQTFYNKSYTHLYTCAESIIQYIDEQKIQYKAKTNNDFFDNKRKLSGLHTIALATNNDKLILISQDDKKLPWNIIISKISWNKANDTSFTFMSLTYNNDDYAVGRLPINDTTLLVVIDYIGQGQFNRLNKISTGFNEYTQLKQFKEPLNASLQLILGILAMFTLFGAVWYGFRLSKEFTEPLLALSQGTIQIAKGDLNFRLDDSGTDEIAQLIHSFNKMAEDLKFGREQITETNALLAQQNTVIDERRAYIEAILENITTAVITLDAGGRLQTFNKAACATFNANIKMLYGKTPDVFLPPQYIQCFFDMIDTLRDIHNKHWQHQMDFIMRGRTWKLILNAVALRNKQNEIQTYIIAIEDITELEKMQRMAAWHEVARRIAHEIKNPLTPIKLSAQRLERKFGINIDDPIFTQCTDLIINQSERLQNMVQEFSSFARLPEVVLSPNYIKPIFDSLLPIVTTGHPDSCWDMKIDEHFPYILLDNDAMYRAMLNLLNNAAEAIEGTESQKQMKNGIVRVSVTSDPIHHQIKISIQDNGPGLTLEEHDRMFEPYFSRKKGGTGLGLTIVKTIISDHHGTIDVVSRPQSAHSSQQDNNVGTLIIVSLPICDSVQDIQTTTNQEI